MDSAKPCLLEILKHSIATATCITACIESLKVTNGRLVTEGLSLLNLTGLLIYVIQTISSLLLSHSHHDYPNHVVGLLE
jgi:hypothetical protein